MAQHFKIGERVRIRLDARNFGDLDDVGPGDEGFIRKYTRDEDYSEEDDYSYEFVRDDGEWERVRFSQIELINKEGVIMSLVSKVRNLALSKETRLRRKHGVEDEYGRRTPEGTELLLDLLYAANSKEIDEKIAAVDAEEKAEKK